MRAIANIDSFQPGTNMSAWLFTILRNLFRSEYRKRRREVEDTDGSYADTLKSQPEQGSRLEFNEFRVALDKLPPDQREVLMLVGASGFSYEEAAEICNCAVGTIKSRVNRARTRLADLLSIEGAEDFPARISYDARHHGRGRSPLAIRRSAGAKTNSGTSISQPALIRHRRCSGFLRRSSPGDLPGELFVA